MDARQRRKLSMARRVLDFARANPADDPGYNATVERLATAVAAAEQFAETEREAVVDERGALERRTLLRERLGTIVQHVVSVGALAVKERPDLVGTFRTPRSRGANRVFLSDAAVLHQRAVDHQDVLLAHGLGADILAEMATVLEQAAVEGAKANEGRNGHIKAGGQLYDTLLQISQYVRVLDTFNRARFAPDSGERRAWKSARDIFGPVQRTEHGNTPPPSPSDEAVA